VNCNVAKDGMLHASEADLRGRYVADMTELVSVGDRIHATVLSVDGQAGRFTLSRRASEPEPRRQPAARERMASADRAPEFPALAAAPVRKAPLVAAPIVEPAAEPAVEPAVEVRSRAVGDAILHAADEEVATEAPDVEAEALPSLSAAAILRGTQRVPQPQPAPMEVLLTKMIRGKVHTLYKMP